MLEQSQCVKKMIMLIAYHKITEVYDENELGDGDNNDDENISGSIVVVEY